MDCIRGVMNRPATKGSIEEALKIVVGRQRGYRIEAEALKKRLPQIAAEGTDEAFRVAVARLHTIELALRQCNNARSFLNVGLAAFRKDSWPRTAEGLPAFLGPALFKDPKPLYGKSPGMIALNEQEAKNSDAEAKIASEETDQDRAIRCLAAVELNTKFLRRALTDILVRIHDQEKAADDD